MCLIVDANVAHLAFIKREARFEPILAGLTQGSVRIVVGGKLTSELLRIRALVRLLGELDRAGRLRRVNDGAVEIAEQTLLAGGQIGSDDPHILALAIVGSVRLLCTDDKALMDDFKNKSIIDKPRGSIYHDEKHKKLLSKHCKCLRNNQRIRSQRKR